MAPEHILSVSCETASDMYSLGTIVYTVFNIGKPIFEVNKYIYIYKSFSMLLDQLSCLGSNSLTSIPEEVHEHMKVLLNVTPAVRPHADQMTNISFSADASAVTLQYSESLLQRDNLQKSVFQRTTKGSTKTAKVCHHAENFDLFDLRICKP